MKLAVKSPSPDLLIDVHTLVLINFTVSLVETTRARHSLMEPYESAAARPATILIVDMTNQAIAWMQAQHS
jgi:hypothetical protein